MANVPTGGAAFPYAFSEDQYAEKGMSLRDWFAGQVSIGYLSAHADPDCRLPKPEVIATWAYKVADAMLVERSKPEGQ